MILEFERAKKLAKKYKIPIVPTKKIDSFLEGKNFAKKFGFPLVLKIDHPEIIHKTAIGGVITDIENLSQLKNSFQKIKKISKRKKGKILIQKQLKGVELILGAKRDPLFGGVVMFGLGGIFVEVLKDISFRLAPISKNEAKKMIKEIKGYKIIQGFGQKKKVNIEKISEILVNLSFLISKEKFVKEVDLNPVIADSKNAYVVDIKIVPDVEFSFKNESKNF